MKSIGSRTNIINLLNTNYQYSIGETVKAKDGRILTTENEEAERWKTHFEEVLNRPEPEITAEPKPGCELELDIRPPTFQEVKAAIISLKNDKAQIFKLGPLLIFLVKLETRKDTNDQN